MGMTKTVKDAFFVSNTDKGYYHQYEYMYANIFSSCTPKSILEIGVKDGNSIKAWQMLFPEAKISGMDIVKSKKLFDMKPFDFIEGSSTNYETTSKLDNYDIIIDDGSHHILDQIITFSNLKNKFNYFYVIEDISFVGNNIDVAPNVIATANVLKACIRKMGFYGISMFDSYNTHKKCCSLVIQSKEF